MGLFASALVVLYLYLHTCIPVYDTGKKVIFDGDFTGENSSTPGLEVFFLLNIYPVLVGKSGSPPSRS